MDEEELKRIIYDRKRADAEFQRQRQEYGRQIDVAFLKMPIEGLISTESRIELSNDLIIEKVDEQARTEFFRRAASLELVRYEDENNSHFLTYRYEDERRETIDGMETGKRILLVAIFFALGLDKLVKINKSQGFVPAGDELKSIGITRIPSAPWYYEKELQCDNRVVEELRKAWPLFKTFYISQPHFSLVCRRYYFSLIRNQWEDRLVDLIIALEALLIPETDEANKGGKMASRLSRLLDGNFLRGEVSAKARDCYALRNQVVHGDTNYSSPSPYDMVEELNLFVKSAITTSFFNTIQ